MNVDTMVKSLIQDCRDGLVDELDFFIRKMDIISQIIEEDKSAMEVA